MINMKKHILSMIVITLLIAAWALTGSASQEVSASKTDKSLNTKTQGKEINAEVMKKAINLYRNLSEDKQIAIKEKMAKMSQDRQKAIEAVQKQIKEYRLQKLKNQQTNSSEEQINRLQVLKEFALQENAPQIAQKFERLIGLYEHRQFYKSLIDNRLKIE